MRKWANDALGGVEGGAPGDVRYLCLLSRAQRRRVIPESVIR